MGVPGVARADARAAALEPPVLEVVDDLEQPAREERPGARRPRGRPSRSRRRSPPRRPTRPARPWSTRLRSRRGSKFDIASSPRRFFSRRQALANWAGTVRAVEALEALAEARRRRVLRRRDAQVMAAQVLGVEVLVEHAAEQRAAEALLAGVPAVDQLVGRDDRVARARADHDVGHQEVEGEQILRREQPHEERDVHELQRGEGVHDRVEGPVGQPLGRLAQLAAPRGVEEVRDDEQARRRASARYQGWGPVTRNRKAVPGNQKASR